MTTGLAIDTASTSLSVALGTEARVLAQRTMPSGQDHSRLLLPTIDEVTLEAGSAPEVVIVTGGPGSYAGLRVGIATAQGLALARGIPVVGVGTFEAIARASGRDPVTAIHPAGRGEFGVQRFEGGHAAVGPRLVSPAELDLTCAGEGAGELGGFEVGPAERCRAALLIGLERHALGGEGVVPFYLREPSITRPKRAPAAGLSRRNP